jgi:hypothetical protein
MIHITKIKRIILALCALFIFSKITSSKVMFIGDLIIVAVNVVSIS